MDDLDVINICTPSYLHVAQTLQALAAGKHVVCEKPIAGSLAALDALAEAEALCGRRVMPVFNGHLGQFGQAMLNNTELPVTLADARRTIELLTAIYASARAGAVVDLPIGSEHPLYGGWLP